MKDTRKNEPTPAEAIKAEIVIDAGIDDILDEMRKDKKHDAETLRKYADRIQERSKEASKIAAAALGQISGRDIIAAAVRNLNAEAEAAGAVWDENNTEAAVKTFTVSFKIDALDRLKLGLLAAKCQCTPERWLEIQLKARFSMLCEETFERKDTPQRRTYEALIIPVLDGLARNGARLCFKPAIMA